MYAKDPNEVKYQLLINKCEKLFIDHFNSKAFIEYSKDMNDIYRNTEEDNPGKECKILVVFDNMNADVLSDKKT